MRAWKMTAGLAVAALVAALFAPRLMSVLNPTPACSEPIGASTPTHPTLVDTGIARPSPRPQQALIPEMSHPPTRQPAQPVPVATPTPPDPGLEGFWGDACPACGRG
jgi:hypothetical protein